MGRLFVISREDCFSGEIDLINKLFEAGMAVFHLRKPGISLKNFADLLTGIDPVFYDRLVLHQFHEYAPDWDISRLHYSELKRASFLKENMTEKVAQFDTKNSLSTSIHSLPQANELNGFDYSFFSPVFDSISKQLYKGTLLSEFNLPVHLRAKLVALGGISTENIETVFEMGFNKAAVLGAIWNNPLQALDNFERLQEKCPYMEVKI